MIVSLDFPFEGLCYAAQQDDVSSSGMMDSQRSSMLSARSHLLCKHRDPQHHTVACSACCTVQSGVERCVVEVVDLKLAPVSISGRWREYLPGVLSGHLRRLERPESLKHDPCARGRFFCCWLSTSSWQYFFLCSAASRRCEVSMSASLRNLMKGPRLCPGQHRTPRSDA